MKHIALSIWPWSFQRARFPRAPNDAYVPPPLADHHQHLFSPALAALMSPAPPGRTDSRQLRQNDLITLLDAAGIKRAVIFIDGLYLESAEEEGRKRL